MRTISQHGPECGPGRVIQRAPQRQGSVDPKRRARPLVAALLGVLALAAPHAVNAEAEIDRTLEMPARVP